MENTVKDKFSDEYICKNYLDNADVIINYNPHNNYVDFDFLVWGKVDEKYWKITIACDEVYQFNIINKDADENAAKVIRSQYVRHIIFNVTIAKDKISGTDIWKHGNMTHDLSIFTIEVEGPSVFINIKCKYYKIAKFELGETEYNQLLKIFGETK